MQTFLHEARTAARAVARAPLHSTVVVATLAIAIGLDATLFSVAHQVLLRPLGFARPDELVAIHRSLERANTDRAAFSAADYREIRTQVPALADVAAFFSIRQNLAGADRPRQVWVGWVSRNFFSLLGVEAELGRLFSADDPPGTAVLAAETWRTAFGADPGVLGRTVRLDDHPYTIVGVVGDDADPALLGAGERPAVWKVPDAFWQNGDVWAESVRQESAAVLQLFGRLREGAVLDRTRAELDGLAAALRSREPEWWDEGTGIVVEPLLDSIVGDTGATLWLLFGATTLVLVVACSNLLHLMLARARARRSERELRHLLGAPRARIVLQALLESSILALAGGAGGVFLARQGLALAIRLAPPGVPRLEAAELSPLVLLFSAGLVLGATLVFGLLPVALEGGGGRLATLVARRSTETLGQRRWGSALVVAQLAASIVLLVAAGLLGRSLQKLLEAEPGFRTQALATFTVSLPGSSYERPEGTDRFFRQLERRLEAQPGVERAATLWPLPLVGGDWAGGWAAEGRADEESVAGYRLATPTLFDTLGLPFVEGRTFAPSDPRFVAIVSRALAEKAWPGESALGKKLSASPWGPETEPFEVIGVVENVRFRSLRDERTAAIYFDSRGWSWTDWEVYAVVRARPGIDPATLLPGFSAALAQLDPSLPLASPRTMTAYLGDQLAPTRFSLTLVGLFATVSAGLAALGLFGVIAHGVTRRRREMGIRMALGSTRPGVVALVVGEGMRLVGAGTALGLFLAVAVSRWLEGRLFEVDPRSPAVYGASVLALGLVAVVACYLPARRAAGFEPATVLREE